MQPLVVNMPKKVKLIYGLLNDTVSSLAFKVEEV
jgi:hypothetical protein